MGNSGADAARRGEIQKMGVYRTGKSVRFCSRSRAYLRGGYARLWVSGGKGGQY